jgi:hypothetical protein
VRRPKPPSPAARLAAARAAQLKAAAAARQAQINAAAAARQAQIKRMQVWYYLASPAQRAALANYFHPAPPAPAPAPAPRPVVAPPAPRPVVAAPAAPGWTVWDTIAQCEASGNWHANTGNGYSGGLQFSPSTWRGYGGGQFAPMAWMASREQQIVVAERIRAVQGYSAWPVCGRRV